MAGRQRSADVERQPAGVKFAEPSGSGEVMNIAICIIAKDEEDSIGHLIDQISRQTIFGSITAAEILVVCNGCTDRTAEIAGEAVHLAQWPERVRTSVHDYKEAGKARFWNVAVHDLISKSAETALFLDADVELADDSVLENLVSELQSNQNAVAISGWPVKDIALKERKSMIERFSLRVSAQTQYAHSINGSLYAAELECLRKIWLPVPIPGEDGMLSAMIKTEGFTHPPRENLICRADKPTHFYEAHSVQGFFRHEQRMVIGTTINGWLFEHFWQEQYTEHVGQTIRELNEKNPTWVGDLIASKVGNRRWILPSRMLTWRLKNLRNVSLAKAIGRAPFSIGATLLNVWPCISANAILRRKAAANFW
jgi:glycosyltransferase involved in cell wall biosynthesis